MPSLDEIARSRTALRPDDIAWLHAVVTDWQIVADLAFADLVLWVPDAEERGQWAAAQIRPTTGPTTLLEDVAGSFRPADVVADADAEHTVPVVHGGRACATIEVRAAGHEGRTTSALETAYRSSAHDLLAMIAAGAFPFVGARSDVADSLRVGDGFIRLAATGVVEYASPNALSAFRRLGLVGDLEGAALGAVTAELVDGRPTHRGVRGLLQGREPGEAEITNDDVAVALRLIPLSPEGRPVGAIVLLRDVTELRRRERQLVSKEATIREIHHRVKNNLQTVAALLRLQGRRMAEPAAREALEDAVRRVGSIALVHETLSQSFDETVDFDDVADRLLRSVLDVAGDGEGGKVTGQRIGSFGSIPGETATALAMVLTELIQNAAQHAYPESSGPGAVGRSGVSVAANRIRDRLRVRVSDDGVGMPDDIDPGASLGLSIIRTLVESELNGTLRFEAGRRGGTTVTIELEV
ncbi:MAG TPA: histidine kinase N-terminal domain-containing protein [Aeromicrobium sp.]|nr:histidine kinase N-terminal domain-containing protein [Aeromicrobium sp.]